MDFYNNYLNIEAEKVYWIDALPIKIQEAKNRNIPNVYHATITDKDDEIVEFNVTNNHQSSSVLQLGLHIEEFPWCKNVDKLLQYTLTVDSFLSRNKIDKTKLNFWNIDIQGAELLALKGSTDSLQYVDAIYIEVNFKELYIDCCLINDLDEFFKKYNFSRILTSSCTEGFGDALYLKIRK